jgi:hypothetical protein
MSKIQETTNTGSEMGIFSDNDQSISDTELASTQGKNGKTPKNEAEQTKNYLANIAMLHEEEEDPDVAEAKALEGALKKIAFHSRKINVFTKEAFPDFPQDAYVRGGKGSHPYKVEALKETAEALNISSKVAWEVARKMEEMATAH